MPTRFGAMKHLRVLEDAGLVTTRRQGREKLHFLNPVPIRLIYDALWSDEGFSRVTWELEPVGASCRVRVTHDQLRESANSELYGGSPMILSGLKTLLETGEELDTPGSLQYKQGAAA